MVNTEITKIKVKRYIPGIIDPPKYITYEVKLPKKSSIIDALEHIRIKMEPGLLYRHSCHHSSCGTCAMIINDREALACTTKISDINTDIITIEPLKHFKIIGDLLVDFSEKAKPLDKQLNYIRNTKRLTTSESTNECQHFENCIECGACLSACPVLDEHPDFIGPMILAAYNNQLKKSDKQARELKKIITSSQGEGLCKRAIECSRVCPTGVSPARHIQELRNKGGS